MIIKQPICYTSIPLGIISTYKVEITDMYTRYATYPICNTSYLAALLRGMNIILAVIMKLNGKYDQEVQNFFLSTHNTLQMCQGYQDIDRFISIWNRLMSTDE